MWEHPAPVLPEKTAGEDETPNSCGTKASQWMLETSLKPRNARLVSPVQTLHPHHSFHLQSYPSIPTHFLSRVWSLLLILPPTGVDASPPVAWHLETPALGRSLLVAERYQREDVLIILRK
jgi:hypothetical protein